MALNNIEYGSLASSSIMNENFNYLDNRISETSDSILTSISSLYSNIATINARISDIAEELNKTNTELGNAKVELNKDLSTSITNFTNRINEVSMLPNWSKMITLNNLNSYVAQTNGYLLIVPTTPGQGFLTINGKTMLYKDRDVSYDNSSQLVAFPIKKNDVITCTCPTSGIYFIPTILYTEEN